MIISRSTHVAANGIISFFFMAEKYSIVSVHTINFIHSSVDGHIDCFHVLAIVNSAAVKIGMPVSFRIMVFFFPDICPGVDFLDHMVALFLVFKATSILFSIVAASVYIPNCARGFPFLHTLSSIVCGVFDDGHSD